MENCKTSFITSSELPLVVEPIKKEIKKEEFYELLRGNESAIRSQLLTFGGILFRGFPIENADDFATTIETLGLGQFVDYIGGDSPRIKVQKGVYTSTEAPPSFKIPLHNELSFVKNYPSHIYFFCQTPSESGGATILGDARKVYQSVHLQVREKFTEKGLKYVSHYYAKSKLIDLVNSIGKGHKRWKDVFETEEKSEVEIKCKDNEFAYSWHKNDWLEISQNRPAVITHPQTQEKIWFNQVQLYDFNPRLMGWGKYVGAKLVYCRPHTKLHEVYFGDETEIPRPDLYHVHDVLDKNTVSFPWQKGDVLVLDNILSMHGRAPFKGKRRVLAAMTR